MPIRRYAEVMAAPESNTIDIMHHLQDPVVFSIPPVLGVDLSITKNVIALWVSAAICLAILLLMRLDRRYIPGRFRNTFEALLLFVRDQIARPTMGPHGDKYIPYLWTTFIFILFTNYLGFIPFFSTATADLSVTVALALISFAVVHIAGIRQKGLKKYLKDFVPPVPAALFPLMLIVEIISHTTRTVALAIRLFANMVAGHIVVLCILSFILIFQAIWIPVAGISVPAAGLFLVLEFLFKFIQAGVFTLLTAAFIGMAIAEEH